MWLCCESKEGKELDENMATLSVWTLTSGDHIVSFVLSLKPLFLQQFPLLISWIVCVFVPLSLIRVVCMSVGGRTFFFCWSTVYCDLSTEYKIGILSLNNH